MDNILKDNYEIRVEKLFHGSGQVKGFKIRLQASDWLIIRHQEEILTGVQPTLSDDTLAVLRINRQRLRAEISRLETA